MAGRKGLRERLSIVGLRPLSCSFRVMAMEESWSERVRRTIAPAAGESPSLLGASSGIIAVSAIYLYFAGYIFSYFYYQAFGVTLESLDLSPQYYFIRAFTVFQTFAGILLLCVLVAIAYAYAARRSAEDCCCWR